jgi:hypothetical protein
LTAAGVALHGQKRVNCQGDGGEGHGAARTCTRFLPRTSSREKPVMEAAFGFHSLISPCASMPKMGALAVWMKAWNYVVRDGSERGRERGQVTRREGGGRGADGRFRRTEGLTEGTDGSDGERWGRTEGHKDGQIEEKRRGEGRT